MWKLRQHQRTDVCSYHDMACKLHIFSAPDCRTKLVLNFGEKKVVNNIKKQMLHSKETREGTENVLGKRYSTDMSEYK